MSAKRCRGTHLKMRGKKWKKKTQGIMRTLSQIFVCVRSLSCIVFSAVSRLGRTYVFIVTSIEIIVQVEVVK